jgi:hypothetical protein
MRLNNLIVDCLPFWGEYENNPLFEIIIRTNTHWLQYRFRTNVSFCTVTHLTPNPFNSQQITELTE